MNKFRILILAFLLFLSVGVVGAQTKPDDPILKACEETVDKLKRTEIEKASLQEQLKIANERVALRDEQIKNKEEQVQFWKGAAQKGDKIDNNSELIIFNLRQQVADDRLRIKELEDENKSLRSSRTFRTWAAAGLGFGAGYYVRSKQ
jgi:hypothetical protein